MVAEAVTLPKRDILDHAKEHLPDHVSTPNAVDVPNSASVMSATEDADYFVSDMSQAGEVDREVANAQASPCP
jgi:hypothetical protein